jgi:hypothetical protein
MKAAELVATCVLCALPLVVACAGENRDNPPPSYGVTNTQPVGLDWAVYRIADARCDFEQSCNNVGPNEGYASRENCQTRQRGDLAGDLRSDKCPGGVDERQVDACVAQIHGERCGNVLDTVGRLTACRTSALCLR